MLPVLALALLASSAQVDVHDASGQHVHVDDGGVTIRDAQGRTVVRSAGGSTVIRQGGAAHSGYGGNTGASCPGGRLEVTGASQELHVGGVCSYVELSGANNVVYATLAPGATVELTGTRNNLFWTAANPRGRAPHIEYTGVANSATRR